MSAKYNRRPRYCLRNDGKPKVAYADLTEAQQAANECAQKFHQQFSAYACPECEHHHVGKSSTKIRAADKTRVEWIELGDRAAHHLFVGDTRYAINKRYRSAKRLAGKC